MNNTAIVIDYSNNENNIAISTQKSNAIIVHGDITSKDKNKNADVKINGDVQGNVNLNSATGSVNIATSIGGRLSAMTVKDSVILTEVEEDVVIQCTA